MDAFLDEVMLLLPLLGVTHFAHASARHLVAVSGGSADIPVPVVAPKPPVQPSTATHDRQLSSLDAQRTTDTTASAVVVTETAHLRAFTLEERGRGAGGRVTVSGHAHETSAGFVVVAGSYGPAAGGVMSPGYAEMRQRLRLDGILVETGDGSARFSRDHVFRSPSAAATMVAGSNRNGPKSWRDERGRSLAQVREAAGGYNS